MNTRSRTTYSIRIGVLVCASLVASSVSGQDGLNRFAQPRGQQTSLLQVRPIQFKDVLPPEPAPRAPQLRQTVTPEYRATVKQHHSQLVTSDRNITRIAVTAPDIVNFVQYSEKEVALIGLNVGSTDLTLWFENDARPVMYEITVVSGAPKAGGPHAAIAEVSQKLRVVFPRSQVQLIPVADQVVVKGQAHDAAEAKQIMQIVEAQFGGERKTVVNMLKVPGEFQVMLRVRIAELNRTQLRKLGLTSRDLLARSKSARSFGPTTAGISGVFENQDIGKMMRWLSSNGTISYLAEPTLTVLSGHSASFLSGGEYAVQTVVRDGAQHTEIRSYGTKLKVTPTVLDRDLIRLHIAPEFSQVDEKTTVNGVPGTNVRRVDTVVELREGQTIAIGGLVSRQMQTESTRKPGLRPRWFSRQATEADTELLIVVTPEIVRAMDPGEVPPMPNYYVTHPNDTELFVEGRSEGQPHPNAAMAGQFNADQFIPSGTVPFQPPGIQYSSLYPQSFQQPTQQSAMPASILPSDSMNGGYSDGGYPPANFSDQPVRQQPSSGQQLFEMPSGSNTPYQPPVPPSAPDVSSGPRPLHVYPPDMPSPSASVAPPQISERVAPITSTHAEPVTDTLTGPVTHSGPIKVTLGAPATLLSEPKLRPVRSTVSPLGSGHSSAVGKLSTRRKAFEHSTRGAVIPAAGQKKLKRSVSPLPPMGHSIPRSSGGGKSTSGQGH